ncbi:hypothetical protein F4806DRAFT_75890 [Annulohypoxylon nitens]|nr:hypothetical protein F4806DRAFT_75890 [Annulohypoxylon nitens]
MEFISIATGVTKLFSLCIDCYGLLGKMNSAKEDVVETINFIRMEECALYAWGRYWGIDLPGELAPSKLDRYLRTNAYKRNGVVLALSGIGELITNKRKLLKEYRVELKLTDSRSKPKFPKIKDLGKLLRNEDETWKKVDSINDKLKSRIGFLKKCSWTMLGGANEMTKLSDTLHRYNTSLYQFCPEGAGNDLVQFQAIKYLYADHESAALSMAFERIQRLAQEEEDPSIKECLMLLGDMVTITGEAGYSNTKRATGPQRHTMFKYHYDRLRFDREDESSTIAELTWSHGGRSIVYVEFKSYKDDEPHKSRDRRHEILRLGLLMFSSKSSTRLNTMKCFGWCKDIERERIGLIFELPMRLPDNILPWDDYKPRRFKDLLNENIYPPELGSRLQLAKTLVDNVTRIHTVGWLHKNIRSDSLLFFPRSLRNRRAGFRNPFLMGYDYMRVEEDSTSNSDRFSLNSETRSQHQIAEDEDQLPDFYHHPDKRTSPSRAYQYAYDIYSLGLLLIEIGLWKSLSTIVEGREAHLPERLRDYILHKVTNEVAGACGNIYAEVVREFISMKSVSNLDSMRLQRDACARMASELSRCVV